MASLSQGRTAAAQCVLFTHKSVPVIFEPPCMCVIVCFRFLYFGYQKELILKLCRLIFNDVHQYQILSRFCNSVHKQTDPIFS